MYCRKCGKEVKPSAAFCRHCGYEQMPEQKPEKVNDYEQTGSMHEAAIKNWVVVGPVLAIVFLVAFFAFRFFGGVGGSTGTLPNGTYLTEGLDPVLGYECIVKGNTITLYYGMDSFIYEHRIKDGMIILSLSSGDVLSYSFGRQDSKNYIVDGDVYTKK
ncbi:MAG: zinc ribbon domain-containing protein [Oscillospiraceae bacterium]|nr:zinc ribbon domain-containing protein [Oscillospiraceae bacterium]